MELPRMLFADDEGVIYEHPDLLLVGRRGWEEVIPSEDDLLPLPEMSRLFFMPDCPPRGLDPHSGKVVTLRTAWVGGRRVRCHAVAAFLEPGYARTLLPAAETAGKRYVLPLWAYTAVGYAGEKYIACAFEVEYDPHWDPRNFDDRELLPRLRERMKRSSGNPLLRHLAHCAVRHHCFAAKNLFLGRWEAPLPVSRLCNARCLGCLSQQPDGSCPPAHRRISFTPAVEQIVEVAVDHLQNAPDPIVSFGQGCEGEPLTEAGLVAEAIHTIRERTSRGTINLNTNGSMPDELSKIIKAGLDSVRISLNSARRELFERYVRPRDFSMEDVERSLSMCTEAGIFTMINYLIFPGVSDQEEEWEALRGLIQRTGVHLIHLKNLCIDPDLYLKEMGVREGSPAMGMREFARRLQKEFPHIRIGYFNKCINSS
jgi:wyosine [tRNA(Phe)-imidazoG37] synthetase (radical SAM superfamily)